VLTGFGSPNNPVCTDAGWERDVNGINVAAAKQRFVAAEGFDRM
jgi:hypothetical protein